LASLKTFHNQQVHQWIPKLKMFCFFADLNVADPAVAEAE
jgi:hypothetical protein